MQWLYAILADRPRPYLERGLPAGFRQRLCGSAVPIRAPALSGHGQQEPAQQAHLVDYLRNGRWATAVASYSLRARLGAPVALPIAWNELARLKRADSFTMNTVPAKLKRRRKDPWEGIENIKQKLARWGKRE